MRRPSFVVLALGAALLAAGGCSSVGSHASRNSDSRPVSLSGGDGIGRQLFRDSPEFAIACSTPHTDIANVDTSSDGD